jgi:repressor LexA
MRPLTAKQLQVLQGIRRHQVDTGLSPTLQELGETLSVNRVTVYGHVQALLQKGFLENLEPGASRGLDLTDLGVEAVERRDAVTEARTADARRGAGGGSRPTPSLRVPQGSGGLATGLSLPLAGRIAAGAAIEAIEDREDIRLGDFLRVQEDTYLLEVLGDSMIDAHIQSGDYVVVRRDQPPREGDIVVAILDDETATLKRYFPQKDGTYILQPANASMQPIYCDRLEVRGVVTGVMRSY